MLGSFPKGTRFKRIDDIDECALLLALGYKEYEDPYDERAFHVAIWNEDLLEASDLGLVTGVERITERQYEERKRDELRSAILAEFQREGGTTPSGDILSALGHRADDGQFIPLKGLQIINTPS